MSLKTFHFVFIAICLVMVCGVLVWALAEYAREARGGYLVYAGLCLGAGAGLIGYGKYVFKKLKNISYL